MQLTCPLDDEISKYKSSFPSHMNLDNGIPETAETSTLNLK